MARPLSFPPPSTDAARPFRFVALGDSFTEGMCDDLRADGRYLGWADRVALALAERRDGVEYANLAIRGRLSRAVVAEQVPVAVSLAPDLASLACGVNDTLRRHFDLDGTATALEEGARRLRATGAEVLLFSWGNPSRRSRVLGVIRERIRALNAAIAAIAAEYDCHVASFWGAAVMDDDRLWSDDRLHLSPLGHLIAADAALDALGIGSDAWRTPLPPTPTPALPSRAVGHARWFGAHAGPWVMRRVRGTSSGDGLEPKNPTWTPVPAPVHSAR